MIDRYEKCKTVYAETLPSGRTYFTPDGNFPSVTTVLGRTANTPWLDRWKERVGHEEAARISKDATDRGELVHKYLEDFWNRKNDWEECLAQEPMLIQKMVKALKDHTVTGVTRVWAQEIPLWSQLGYAGRVDMVGEWKGIPSIIDFKTSKKKKQVKDIKDYFIQCAAYAHAHNEMFNTQIRNLIVLIVIGDPERPDKASEVQEFPVRAEPFIPELRYRLNQYAKISSSNLS